ncbi:hypothetical protein Tco_0131999, partial [Tanacetum coccineum]
MLLKEQDPLFEKHRVNTKPINYAILNNDYYKRFVRQTDLYCEQANLYCEHAYWKATSVPALDPSHSSIQPSKLRFQKNFLKMSNLVEELADVQNVFYQYLVEELADVQNVFYQMEQAVKQHSLESKTFKVRMNQVLSENERLLAQAIDHDIVKIVVNLSVNDGCKTVNECQKCLELKTELLNKK